MPHSRSRSRSPSPRRSRSRSGDRDRDRGGARRGRSPSWSPDFASRRNREAARRSPDELTIQHDSSSGGYRLHLSELPRSPDMRKLAKVFSNYGELVEPPWIANTHPAFGFVVYRYKDQALEAVKEVDGTYMDGTKIRVSIAKPRTKGQRRNLNGPARCYSCGKLGHFARDCNPPSPPSYRDRYRSRSRSHHRRRSSRS